MLHRKNCIQSIECCITDAQKQQKSNVIDYKHETNVLAYTFKAGSC